MNRDYEPEFPKPYTSIPFAARVERSSPAGHHKIAEGLLTGVLELRMTCLRPVQVASGELEFMPTDRGEQLAAQHASISQRRQGVTAGHTRTLVIPGASLKGAIRSVVEAISPSCVPVTEKRTKRVLPALVTRCSSLRKLCVACKLFGATIGKDGGYMGQAVFQDIVVPSDAVCTVQTPVLMQAGGHGKELPPSYLSGDHASGRKLYHHGKVAAGRDLREVVRQGTELSAQVQFLNLSSSDLGVLIVAMGCTQEHQFGLKIGGGKPVGLGSVSLSLEACALSWDWMHAGRLGAGLQRLEGSRLDSQVREWVSAALDAKSVLPDRLRMVADALSLKALDTMDMPDGPY